MNKNLEQSKIKERGTQEREENQIIPLKEGGKALA